MPISERVMLSQITTKSIKLNIVQACAPTVDKPNETVGKLYKDLESALKFTKKNDINIVMGDFSAKIGSERVENIAGDFGNRNERGDRLLQFWREKEYVITNTWVQASSP